MLYLPSMFLLHRRNRILIDALYILDKLGSGPTGSSFSASVPGTPGSSTTYVDFSTQPKWGINMQTFPSAISMSSKPQSLDAPFSKCAPSANLTKFHPSVFLSATLSEQHPILRGSFRSPANALTSVITVAAWLTSRILLCSGHLASTAGMNTLRNSSARSCTSSTFSPLRDGYQVEDHSDGSIWGKYCTRVDAAPGRGWRPVFGATGEYHSLKPKSGL